MIVFHDCDSLCSDAGSWRSICEAFEIPEFIEHRASLTSLPHFVLLYIVYMHTSAWKLRQSRKFKLKNQEPNEK